MGDCVSNHQLHHCLPNCLFRCRSKKTSRLRVTGLCVGNSLVTREFPAQMASNTENVFIWWRHHIRDRDRDRYCIVEIYRIMHELPWITIFGHDWGDLPIFSWVTKSWVKIIGKSLHEWSKIVIYGNEWIILFLTRYFMSWTHHSATNKHRLLISVLSLRTVFSDLTLWRHHSWSVTSREHEVLALWCHIHQLFLHTQIGAKAIFTSE